MNIFVSMLVSSSTLFVLFVVAMHFFHHIFNQRHRYAILKAALIMAIIPIAYIKPMVKHLLNQFIPRPMPVDFFVSGKLQTVMETPAGAYSNIVYRDNVLLTKLWISMAVLIFIWYLYKHLKFRKWVLCVTHKPNRLEPYELVEKYRELLHIKRNVNICTVDVPVSPFTIGILRPVIVIPELSSLEEVDMIINHEMNHIKRNDGLIRFLRVIVVGTYWFNPLIYLLDSYLEQYCEFACDETVTEGLSKECKKKYGYLIVDMASSNSPGPTAYITPFSGDKNIIKRRMELIMTSKKQSKKCAVALTIGMVLCSSFTTMAYQGANRIVLEEDSNADVFLENSKQTIRFMVNGEGAEHTLYDEQFKDENGNIYPINEMPSKKACSHSYIDGEYQKHTKNKNGSCLAKTYNAQRCGKCGILKMGTFIRETKYAACPY